jgi:hypothetical protein
MTAKKRIFGLAALILCMSIFSTALAHDTYVLNTDGTRNFTENRKHFLKVSLGHTCGEGAYDIVHSGIVFPISASAVITQYSMTTAGAPDTASTSTTLSDLSTVVKSGTANANAVMSIKPSLNPNFRKVTANKGAVPAFGSSSATTDTLSIYYINAVGADGHKGMSNDYTQNLEFPVTLGKLQNCVAKLRVYTPVCDYCTSGYINAWIGDYTPTLSASRATSSNGKLSVSSAPYFDIVRDSANALSSSCGTGQIVTVMPSASDIDSHLGQPAPSWIGNTSGSSPQQCPAGQHWMDGGCMDN